MAYKPTNLKKIIKYTLFIVGCVISFMIYDYWKYAMFVYSAPEDDPMDVTNKKWFSAKKWLADGTYIRTKNKRIAVKSVPILFPFEGMKSNFIEELYDQMRRKYPKLKQQSYEEFYSKIGGSLEIKYHHTSFNHDEPINSPLEHFFIISYIYNETHFETMMCWRENTEYFWISGTSFSTEKGRVSRESKVELDN